MAIDSADNRWDEELSRRYLDYGRYFVPAREQQMQIMIDLLAELPPSSRVLELCCGEGLLAEMLLEQLPGFSYVGLDGSDLMLAQAHKRLSRFSGRFQLRSFNLGGYAWRKIDHSVHGVVSSLAIHHLDGEGKQKLFQDVYTMLSAGGVFIVADMVEPATPVGRSIAADALDEAVRQRSIELDGNTEALDFFLGEGWNTYRYFDPDDIDHPTLLFDQLKWLEQAGFSGIDLHFMQAGHSLFSGWKKQ